jgi:hypothetical protein
MQAKVSIKLPKKWITSEDQLTTTSGYHLGSLEGKKLWYKTIAQKIYQVSQVLVPVDTGALKKSGRIRQNSDGTYRVEYVGMPYAVFVHEIMGLRHEMPTQSKFLEDAAYIVLGEMSKATGDIMPLFTFHLELGMREGVILYIDSISREEFLGYVKDAWSTDID